MSLAALILGGLFGCGLLLAASALAPARTPLDVAAARLQQPAAGHAPPDAALPGSRASAPETLQSWLGRALAPHFKGITARPATRGSRPPMAADLAVCGLSIEGHVGAVASAAAAGAVAGPGLAALAALSGVALPLPLLAVLALGAGPFAGTVAHLWFRQRAAARRAEFRAALGSYLDLVAMLLAANEGTEGALALAADAGEGWPFARIRNALLRGRPSGQPAWLAFEHLGEQLAIPELAEIAAAASLGANEGAAVRRSLVAKAKAMRGHALADEEAAAREQSKQMVLPVIVMALGFLVFVFYPALAQLTAT